MTMKYGGCNGWALAKARGRFFVFACRYPVSLNVLEIVRPRNLPDILTIIHSEGLGRAIDLHLIELRSFYQAVSIRGEPCRASSAARGSFDLDSVVERPQNQKIRFEDPIATNGGPGSRTLSNEKIYEVEQVSPEPADEDTPKKKTPVGMSTRRLLAATKRRIDLRTVMENPRNKKIRFD